MPKSYSIMVAICYHCIRIHHPEGVNLIMNLDSHSTPKIKESSIALCITDYIKILEQRAIYICSTLALSWD